MSAVLDRAKATTATAGTGTVTLGAAVSPYQSWSAAGAQNATTYPYLIEDATAWEIGYGTYTTAGTTLTRTLLSSSTGSLLSLSGGATVACVDPSYMLNEDGASVNADETISFANNTWGDLATVGPQVTLLTGTSAFVWLSADVYNSSGAGNTGVMSVAVSGATTIAAGTWIYTPYSAGNANFNNCQANCGKITGLTPGLNTFKIQYLKDGAVYHFVRRNLIVKGGI